MGGLIDIMGCVGYTNCRLTQVLGRRLVSSGGKIWLIFKDVSRSSQALRGALAGRSLWRSPSAARRSRSISRRAPRTAEAVVAQIRSAGGRAIAVRADVSIGAQVADMAARVAGEFGAVDVLVNNAGVAITGVREEDFDRGIAVNLKSAFLCTEAVLPAMMRAPLGADRQHLLRRGERAGSARRRLQRVKGRARGLNARLCVADGEGRDHRERDRAWAHRHRDGRASESRRRRGPHPRRTHGARGRCGAGDGHGHRQRASSPARPSR